MSGSVTHTGEHETRPACIANAKKGARRAE